MIYIDISPDYQLIKPTCLTYIILTKQHWANKAHAITACSVLHEACREEYK